MNRGAWQATVNGVAKSWTQLSNFYFHLEKDSFIALPGKEGPVWTALPWQLLLLLTALRVVQGLMIALCSQHSRPFSEASF